MFPFAAEEVRGKQTDKCQDVSQARIYGGGTVGGFVHTQLRVC